jgi:DNA-binding GntR family transcriptional regulator
LDAEGIVEIKPNRGSFKVKLTDQDITEIMLIRESLEGLCMRLAAENMKDDVIEELEDLLEEFEAKDFEREYQSYIETNIKFYEIIYRTAKSPKLVNLIQSMRDLTQMIRLNYMKNPDNVRYSLNAHRELIGAFKRRHQKLAEGIRKKMLRYGYHYQMSK